MTSPMPPVQGQGEVLPELDVFPPQRQRRWTVLPRALLAIPHGILAGQNIAVSVLAATPAVVSA